MERNKKILIAAIVALTFAIPFLVAHSTSDEQPSAYRGCVASAHQATTHGFEADLEANLAICDKLLVAN